MRYETIKDFIEFVFYWPSTTGHVAYPHEEFASPVILWRELILICKWLSISDSFWDRNEVTCLLLLSVLEPHLVQTHTGLVSNPYLICNLCGSMVYRLIIIDLTVKIHK